MYPQPVRLRHPIPATPPTRLSPALEWDVRLTPFILSALLLFSLAGCATARNYLDPDRPLYEGAFARPSSAAAGVVRDTGGTSDHYPVRVTLRLDGEPMS